MSTVCVESPQPASHLERSVVAGAAVLYVLTAARSVLGGDNGEFVTLAATGGVAHPPGYPLYLLWLRAMSWLPAANAAHRAALATAILGVVCVVLLQRAARAWGATAFASALVSGLFAFSKLTWQLSTSAEVFTMNAALALAIVALAAPSSRMRGESRALLFGLFAGLGLSNHHSIVLLAPIGLTAAWLAVRASARPSVAVALALAGLVVGLLPYGYVVYEARYGDALRVLTWGNAHTLSGLLRHFLRAEYGTTSLGISKLTPEPLAQVAALARTMTVGMLGFPVLAIVAVTIHGARTRLRASLETRARWAALVLSFVAAGPLFVARFNLPPRGLGALIVERFHLLPTALLCVIAAPAVGALLPTVETRRWLAASIVAGASVVSAVLAFPDVQELHRPTVELYARNVLSFVPENAIIVGSGDHRFGAFSYARYALGLRKDVVFVNARLLLGDWYPAQAERLLGIPVVRARDHVLNAGELTTQLLATNRPVFFTEWIAPGLDQKLASYPVGPLLRIVTHPREVPAPPTLEAMNLSVLDTLTFESTPPRSEDSWAGQLMRDYARPWLTLATAYAAAGELARADVCRRRASVFLPWTRPH